MKGGLTRFAPPLVVFVFLISVPIWLDISIISLITKILIFGLLAMSLDMVFGYLGLWSFCHAALFGVAAYAEAILIQHFGISSFWIIAPLSIFITAGISALFAWIGLRMSGIYFLLITLAFGQLVFSVVFTWKAFTGGSQGLVNIPYPDIGVEFSASLFYYFVLAVVLLCSLILDRILKSPFGYSLRGVRDNETRMVAMGFNTWMHKFIAFVLSGAFAGAAGILYVHYNGIIIPSNVDVASSGLITVMVIIGGSGTLWGAMIGCAFIYVLSYFISLITPERWPLILGACFVAAVMFSRGGIYPRLVRLWSGLVSHGNKRQVQLEKG